MTFSGYMGYANITIISGTIQCVGSVAMLRLCFTTNSDVAKWTQILKSLSEPLANCNLKNGIMFRDITETYDFQLSTSHYIQTSVAIPKGTTLNLCLVI